MASSIKGTSGEDLSKVVQMIANVLLDDDVRHFGLAPEVIATAMVFLKENPSATIQEALTVGFTDWDL